MKLKDKVIVITGACGLIGKEFVKACLNEGAVVILSDINAEAGQQELKALNHEKAHFVVSDITAEQSVKNLIEASVKIAGKIDALVSNAYPRNKNYGARLEDVSSASFNENVTLHLGGFYTCMKMFSEFFLKQGHGNIVSMGSIYGVVAPRFEVYEGTPMTMPVEYAAIKSAIIHLTRYYAAYYKNTKLRFNAISPGGVFNHQPQDFVDRYNQYAPMIGVKDLLPTLVYLLSDDSLNVNGKNFIIDNGWTKDLLKDLN